jgi:hypothetical protein
MSFTFGEMGVGAFLVEKLLNSSRFEKVTVITRKEQAQIISQ